MKRDAVICSLILLYCLAVGLFMLKPNFILAKPALEKGRVKSVSTVSFSAARDVPDPNQIFALANKERVSRGVDALVANEKLGDIAADRAADMVKRKYYAHKDPDGAYYYDLFPSYNISAKYSCENLDLIFIPDSRTVVTDWLTSNKGHRECMLNRSLTQAGYAAMEMTYINYNGQEIPAYLVVAIHTAELR